MNEQMPDEALAEYRARRAAAQEQDAGSTP